MYGSKCVIRRNAYTATAEQVRLSKNRRYERPYNVKGVIKLAGSKLKPNAKCTDRVIGTRKGAELETIFRRRK